jgi:hypothetical protein
VGIQAEEGKGRGVSIDAHLESLQRLLPLFDLLPGGDGLPPQRSRLRQGARL